MTVKARATFMTVAGAGRKSVNLVSMPVESSGRAEESMAIGRDGGKATNSKERAYLYLLAIVECYCKFVADATHM